MNSRNTLIMLLVTVLLVGAAYMMKDVTPRDYGKGTPTPTPPPLFSPSIAVSDVVQVAVQSTAGTTLTMTHQTGTWLTNGQASNDQVDGMINRIISPTVETALFDRKPEDYGFGTPQLTVTIKTGSQSYVLLLGDDAPADPSVYVRVNGQGPIFVINNADLNQLKTWVDVPPYAPTPTPAATTPLTGTMGTTDTLGSSAAISGAELSPIGLETPVPAADISAPPIVITVPPQPAEGKATPAATAPAP